jgi:hypothetical protein
MGRRQGASSRGAHAMGRRRGASSRGAPASLAPPALCRTVAQLRAKPRSRAVARTPPAVSRALIHCPTRSQERAVSLAASTVLCIADATHRRQRFSLAAEPFDRSADDHRALGEAGGVAFLTFFWIARAQILDLLADTSAVANRLFANVDAGFRAEFRPMPGLLILRNLHHAIRLLEGRAGDEGALRAYRVAGLAPHVSRTAILQTAAVRLATDSGTHQRRFSARKLPDGANRCCADTARTDSLAF